jgi:DNA-binding NarL/FixJ family response regulator
VAKLVVGSPDDLVGLLRNVARDRPRLLASWMHERGADVAGGACDGLTQQEMKPISSLRDGWDTEASAHRMCLGAQTVMKKTTLIGKKLGVSGRGGIVAFALAEGLAGVPSKAPA